MSALWCRWRGIPCISEVKVPYIPIDIFILDGQGFFSLLYLAMDTIRHLQLKDDFCEPKPIISLVTLDNSGFTKVNTRWYEGLQASFIPKKKYFAIQMYRYLQINSKAERVLNSEVPTYLSICTFKYRHQKQLLRLFYY